MPAGKGLQRVDYCHGNGRYTLIGLVKILLLIFILTEKPKAFESTKKL